MKLDSVAVARAAGPLLIVEAGELSTEERPAPERRTSPCNQRWKPSMLQLPRKPQLT